ncbi:hypothetical protein I5Q17_23545 [Serratia ureilytica]|uniref:hypothetical protein n=1 Tax=Serratia ureilytica TaxID=300181 RepID=UPI0018D6E8DB|nr:hypothetical protein [Serratia ureilytica]MBH2947354.1 hypothetical protein [Serratia ureilytica]
MEDALVIWDKVQNMQLDLLIFVLFLFFAFKFKDVTDLLIKLSTLKTEKLKSAKELLDMSGDANSPEMDVVKELMRAHALRLAVGLVSDRGRDIYCRLFTRYGSVEMYSLHKTMQFITVKDGELFFDDSMLRKRKMVGFFVMLFVTFFLLYMSLTYRDMDGLNLSWLFSVFVIAELGGYMYFLMKTIPDDSEVRRVKVLLKNLNCKDFR